MSNGTLIINSNELIIKQLTEQFGVFYHISVLCVTLISSSPRPH